MISENEKVFLDILKASLVGENPPTLPELSENNRASLIQIAYQHKVLPLVYETCYPVFSNAGLRQMVLQQVVEQMIKTSEFLGLYQRLVDSGVHPIVVKGIVCRSLYPNPDHRLSADEDVLISPDEFDMACAVLAEFGMTTTEQDPNAYEFPYRKDGSPLFIELQKNLFPPKSQAYGDWNRYFSHVFSDIDSVIVDGVTIYTMKPTDHLLYLILHALKHFMHSGFGIRQVCDVAVFSNRWGECIDWKRLWDVCHSVNGVYFAAAIFSIGKQYFAFDDSIAGFAQYWGSLNVEVSPMLQDLLNSGIYGSASASRMHSSNMTLDAVERNEKRGSGKASVWGSVFPAAAKLEGRYPYLKKYPWLLAVAWCSRIMDYRKEMKQCGENDALEAVRIGTRRVDLLRLYGVIK